MAAAAAEADGDDLLDQMAGEQVKAPLVLQCGECGEIVGDSFAWVGTNQELQALTLSGAHVETSAQLMTSREGPDLGSTYSSISCKCGKVLGRIYRTTPRDLDSIRDMYTFDIKALRSYALGSAGTAHDIDLSDYPDSRSMRETMVKIQQVLLVLHERMEALEQQDSSSQQSKRQRR